MPRLLHAQFSGLLAPPACLSGLRLPSLAPGLQLDARVSSPSPLRHVRPDLGGMYGSYAVGIPSADPTFVPAAPPTLADTKRKFVEAWKFPIPALYNGALQELLSSQHFVRYNANYEYSPVRFDCASPCASQLHVAGQIGSLRQPGQILTSSPHSADRCAWLLQRV